MKTVAIVHCAVEQHDVHADSSDNQPNVGIGSDSEVEQRLSAQHQASPHL